MSQYFWTKISIIKLENKAASTARRHTMSVSSIKFRNRMRTALAGVMAIWLSGIVLLFCCHPAAALPAMDAYPMAKMSDHCKRTKQHNAEENVLTAPPSVCFQCGFFPVIFDKSRKVEPANKQIALSPERAAVSFGTPVFTAVERTATEPYHPVFTAKRLFIRHCVIRI